MNVKCQVTFALTICNKKGENEKMMKKEFIAKVAHEVNRAYCLGLGDDSQIPWNDAPDWQRKSAITGVEFLLDNDATPEETHMSWLKEKQEDGWVWGPVKDPEKKEHPCFVPYHKLPIEQRVKDYLFKAVIDSFKSEPAEDNGVEHDPSTYREEERKERKTYLAMDIIRLGAAAVDSELYILSNSVIANVLKND